MLGRPAWIRTKKKGFGDLYDTISSRAFGGGGEIRTHESRRTQV